MTSSSTELEPTAPTDTPGPRLWVVLPVFNEAAAIERVIDEWLPALAAADPRFVLLAINDGSTDGTSEILLRLASQEPRLHVQRQENAGHGAACRRGYELATAKGSDATWVLQIDSDGQCDPADLATLWRQRVAHPVQLGRRRREDGVVREATSRLLAGVVSALAGRRIRDPNVPFRLIERRVLARALDRFDGPGPQLANAALSVLLAEVAPVHWPPVRFRRRHAGRSHYRPGRMGRLAAGLLAWQARRRPANALALVAWCAVVAGIVAYGAHNLGDPAVWYDEAMQIHTSLGIDPRAAPFTPGGDLRAVVTRNRLDQLDPGGFGVLLHVWIEATGTRAPILRLLSGLLVLAGLAALATLAGRWLGHPLAPPTAVGLALADPLIREHAVEVRPYALELAAIWIAFWAADRLLARPSGRRGLVLGLTFVALIGSRYTGFLATAALGGALLLHLLPPRPRPDRRRHPVAVAAMLLPPLLAFAVIARWSIPGLIARSSWAGGTLVSYLDPHTAATLSPIAALTLGLRHLLHPATLALTVAAAFAVWPGHRGAVAPHSLLVRRAALLALLSTLALWPWLPWDPALKWSLYLRAISLVCLLRLAADARPALVHHPMLRRAALALALGVVALGSGLAATHQRWRWDVALPALERIGQLGDRVRDRSVAIDPHPFPQVRYHYEYGTLRGRHEYPRAFLLTSRVFEPPPASLCSADWMLSFASIRSLEERYPGLHFEEDPVADQLLRVGRSSSEACR